MTVLVVDDSTLITAKITELLEDVTCVSEVRVSNSYEDAIALINSFKPDVILLDINLPGKSGIDLLKYTKEISRKTHIIMVSNQTEDYYRTLCEKLGADGFVDKSRNFDSIPGLLSSFQ